MAKRKKRKKPLYHLWTLSMKDKSNLKKAREGYSDVSYEDTFDVSEVLANIIAKHLRAFLKSIKESPYGGFPGEFEDKYGHEKGWSEWHNTLRKMIYAFEEYNRKPYLDDMEFDEDFNEIEKDEDEEERKEALEAERQKRIKEGMQLFIDYFNELWW